jgi:hypothetical protein
MVRKGLPAPPTREEMEWLASLAPGDEVERRFDGSGVPLMVTQRAGSIVICNQYVLSTATKTDPLGDMKTDPPGVVGEMRLRQRRPVSKC